MDEHEAFWLRAYRQIGTYPSKSVRSGKWMFFIYQEKINDAWEVIRTAVEKGKLGETAKVATARRNPKAVKERSKPICVYTYDSDDKADVLRILQSLRELGFSQATRYKTDEATLDNEYSFNTNGPVSKYYAREGMVELLTPHSKYKTPRSRNKRKNKIFPRRIATMDELEDALQVDDFYSSAYFQEIMQRDD